MMHRSYDEAQVREPLVVGARRGNAALNTSVSIVPSNSQVRPLAPIRTSLESASNRSFTRSPLVRRPRGSSISYSRMSRSQNGGLGLSQNLSTGSCTAIGNPNLQPVSGFKNLPHVHETEEVMVKKDDKCALCLAPFRSLKRLLSRTHHNCAKCGISVCEKCSLNKVRLSLADETPLRTCNRCYAKMQNEALINFYLGLLQSKNSQIKSLDTRR